MGKGGGGTKQQKCECNTLLERELSIFAETVAHRDDLAGRDIKFFQSMFPDALIAFAARNAVGGKDLRKTAFSGRGIGQAAAFQFQQTAETGIVADDGNPVSGPLQRAGQPDGIGEGIQILCVPASKMWKNIGKGEGEGRKKIGIIPEWFFLCCSTDNGFGFSAGDLAGFRQIEKKGKEKIAVEGSFERMRRIACQSVVDVKKNMGDSSVVHGSVSWIGGQKETAELKAVPIIFIVSRPGMAGDSPGVFRIIGDDVESDFGRSVAADCFPWNCDLTGISGFSLPESPADCPEIKMG